MFRRVSVVAAIMMYAFAARAEDARQMVSMPAMMQEHMLSSMREHLDVLNTILADVAAERFEAAAKEAEEKLGMSSFDRHGAAHMAQFMPEGMQQAGNQLHRAASRFALAAQDADLDRSYASMRKLTSALSEMTAACTSCHAGYRIR